MAATFNMLKRQNQLKKEIYEETLYSQNSVFLHLKNLRPKLPVPKGLVNTGQNRHQHYNAQSEQMSNESSQIPECFSLLLAQPARGYNQPEIKRCWDHAVCKAAIYPRYNFSTF